MGINFVFVDAKGSKMREGASKDEEKNGSCKASSKGRSSVTFVVDLGDI